MAQYTKRYEITEDTYIDGAFNEWAEWKTRNNYSDKIQLLLKYRDGGTDSKGDDYVNMSLFKADFSELKFKKIIDAYMYAVVTGTQWEYDESCYFSIAGFEGNWDSKAINGYNLKEESKPFSGWTTPVNFKREGTYSKIDISIAVTGCQYFDRKENMASMKNGFYIEPRWSEDYRNYEYNINSTKSNNKPYVVITYEDIPPLQPTVFEPNSNYVNNVEEVTFKWKYKTLVPDAQAGFELQWKHELGSWTTVSRTTTSEFYVMPANTLPSGRIEWKVRTKNQFNEWSPWSEVLTFRAIGLPVAPVVSITQQGARPSVTWTANFQQVYQVQILDNNKIVYDSGSVPSISNRSHKVTTFLENGAYTARVRIKNEFDLFSNWGTKEFKVETNKPSPPNLNIYHINDGLMVRIDQDFSDYLLIFRAEKDSEDYKCIAKTNEYEYRDYSVKGDTEYKYFIRVVLDETFVDSQKVMTKAYLKYSTLAPTSNLADYMQLKSNLNSRPEKNMNLSNLSTKQHYTGRQFPVTDYTTFKNNIYSFTFYLKENELYKFIEIYNRKETVLYRDKKISIFGNVDEGLDIGVTDLDGYSVKFTITETDYNEGGSCLD